MRISFRLIFSLIIGVSLVAFVFAYYQQASAEFGFFELCGPSPHQSRRVLHRTVQGRVSEMRDSALPCSHARISAGRIEVPRPRSCALASA